MHTLSLCMIVKNESEVLARCLKSCKDIFDEIIVVDTGSTDDTKQIAISFGAKVYNFEWVYDFSSARNFAFSKASCEYIMWLDADDVILASTRKKIRELKNSPMADVYMFKYNVAFLQGKPTYSFFRERIVKNCTQAVWEGAVHECITPFGKVEYVECAINHLKQNEGDRNRNINIYKKIEKKRKLNAREQYYYARELFEHGKYSKCQQMLNKFIKGKKGWRENVIDAHVLLADCNLLLKKHDKILPCLLKTFTYDSPRANVLCKIGDYCLMQKEYARAIDWYLLATKCKDVLYKGGFVDKTYYAYYPYLQICYCYYSLNDNKTASKYNQMAKRYNNSKIVQSNEKYFNSLSTLE